jgi:hypothetical protein
MLAFTTYSNGDCVGIVTVYKSVDAFVVAIKLRFDIYLFNKLCVLPILFCSHIAIAIIILPII